MDSRAVQTHHAHEYDQHDHNSHNVGLQNVAHGEGEHHHHDHEKKSVLNKVKAKAKKMKDTITKHGHHDHEHGHEHHYDDQHIPDDHDLDEEADTDEDLVEDPEVHGAPIYDSAAVTSAAPGQVHTIGRPGVNVGDTRVMGEEPHHEPRVVVVSPTHGTNQSRAIDPTRTFVGGEKAMQQPKVNLERSMGLEEDPHAPRSTLDAYDPANYQTKVTDPTGAGGAEIDITPLEKSFARMVAHNEPTLNPQPKMLQTVTETHHHSPLSHDQFEPEISTAAKTHYPSAETYGQYSPQPSSEVKTKYPKSHDQFISELSTSTNNPYPSTGTHDQFGTTKIQYPSIGTHDQFGATKTQYPSIGTQDQFGATKTQYPSTATNGQFVQQPQSHDQYFPQQSSATNTQFPSTVSHDQYLPQQSSATNTQYPSAGSHDQFLPEFSTQPRTTQAYNTTTPVEEQSHQPSNQSSYTDKISSATSAIADKAATAKNTVASKLGYGDSNENQTTTQTRHQEETENRSNQSNYTGKISSATSAIADKAVTAKNTVASKLGYGAENETTTQPKHHEETENPSNQSSYTGKISSATSAIADKAASAKNTVASKLGYGDTTENKTTTQTKHQEETEKPPNQSSYTQKISSATSTIADKAVSAKNTVASKLGYGEKGDNVTTNDASSSPTEYGKSVTQSLTEKLAPVYGKESAVKSKVAGTGNENTNVSVQQDKGVSVKDYLVEKLRPSEEDRALSEVISETLHKEEPVKVSEGRGVREVVSDAVHKREEEPERRVERHRPLGKVTESEEVKRRLGSGDEVTERRYEESYENSPGTSVADKLKGMVGSLFTNQDENQQASQGDEDLARNYEEQVNQGAGERILQSN